MLWPSTLVFVTLFETLHGGAKDHLKETRDRMRFFSYRYLHPPYPFLSLTSSISPSFIGIFGWQFLPAVVFPTLTSIAVLCLFNNQSLLLRTLGSGYDGFGFLDFSLDWSVIGGTGALYTPFFAQACYFLGLAFNMVSWPRTVEEAKLMLHSVRSGSSCPSSTLPTFGTQEASTHLLLL